MLKLFKRKPIIYSLYDVFPENAKAVNAINNPMYVVLKYIQKIVYACCDKIIVISEDMKKQIVSLGVNESKLDVVRLWYDENQINNTFTNNKFIQENRDINITNFIIQYAGNFGYTFDYKMILYLAKELFAYQDIQFHMIGNGAFLNDFKNGAISQKLDNILFFPWQSSSIIYDVYKTCSIEIIPLANEVIKNAYPSKSSLLMACAKTFICTTEENSYFYKEVNENKIGVCVNKNKKEDVVNAILELYNNKKKLVNLENNAKKYSEKYLSKTYNCQKFIEIIKEVKEAF